MKNKYCKRKIIPTNFPGVSILDDEIMYKPYFFYTGVLRNSPNKAKSRSNNKSVTPEIKY